VHRENGAIVALPVEYLRCPYCGGGLSLAGGAVRCPSGHSFDLARHGYVDLTGAGRPAAGDSAEMVAARETFLAAGHFEVVTAAVAAEACGAGDDGRDEGCVVEVGAGTGYHLSRARGSRSGIALDSSRHAARRAARDGHGAVVCDVWRGLPVRDGVAAAVLCVFAPRNAAEMRRILAPGGVIVVVTPTPRHLVELVGPLGLVRVDERKPERLAAALGEPERVREIEAQMRLSRDDVAALVAMGPSAHHVDAERVARAAVATLSVHVAVYR
jgi:23S rRNA (guanine745-N1)-methyltransferase